MNVDRFWIALFVVSLFPFAALAGGIDPLSPPLGVSLNELCRLEPSCCKHLATDRHGSTCTVYRTAQTKRSADRSKTLCGAAGCTPTWVFSLDPRQTVVRARLTLISVDADQEMFVKHERATLRLVQRLSKRYGGILDRKRGIRWKAFARLRHERHVTFFAGRWSTAKHRVTLRLDGSNSHHPVIRTVVTFRRPKG
ncbi:MAG: hypothetical protein KC609_06130 [Myxococcales bacterium]|nr:hypothetical protein [Myxococcales bacterium]